MRELTDQFEQTGVQALSTSAPDLLLRIRDVLPRVGCSRATWYRLITAGEAPKPIKVSRKCRAWRAADIAKFQAERLSAHEVAA